MSQAKTEKKYCQRVEKGLVFLQKFLYRYVIIKMSDENNWRRGNFPWIASAPLTKYLSTTFRI